jgi:cation/acetate symporter
MTSAVFVGMIAIYLGIIFEEMNVSFLVGWAFAVAASANLPAILMILFWERTTAQGVSTSIFVGLVSALGLILLSPDMYVRYGLLPSDAPISINSPALISIPASFLALIIVSLLTKKQPDYVREGAEA